MAIAGILEIQMLADMARLKKDMREGRETVERGTKKMSAAVDKLKTAFGALAVAMGVKVFAGFIRGMIEAQDNLAKLSTQLNLSVENLVGWQHAADLGGVNAESLTKGMKKLTQGMVDASLGSKMYVDNFKILGIEIENADGSMREAQDVLEDIADVFANTASSTEKTALAVKVFGRTGLDMIPMLNEGSDALHRMTKEGQMLNPVTAESAALTENLKDNMTRLSKSIKTPLISAFNSVLPLMAQMADSLWDVRQQSLQTQSDFSPLLEVIKTLVILGSEFAFTFTQIGVAIAATMDQIASFTTGGSKAFNRSREEWTQVLEANKREHDLFMDRIRKVGTPEEVQLLRPKTEGKGSLVIPDVEVKGKSPAEKEAERLLKLEDKARDMANAYHKQAVLLGKNGELAKVLYDTTFGGLSEVSEPMKNMLIMEAKLLDAKKKKMEQAENEIAFQEAINAQQMAALAIEMDKAAELAKLDKEKLDALVQSLKTEKELIQEHFDENMDFLMEQHEEKLIAEEDFLQARHRLVIEYEQKRRLEEERTATDLEKFNKMSMRRKAETVFAELANLSAGVATHSRKMFELNKVAGISEALINAYVGISKTLATYPYPLNIGLAIAHGVAAFAQVSAISGATFGGGGTGSAPSLAGSTPATPVTPVGSSNQQSGQTTIVNFRGTENERKTLRAFTKMLNQNTHNGGQVIVQ